MRYFIVVADFQNLTAKGVVNCTHIGKNYPNNKELRDHFVTQVSPTWVAKPEDFCITNIIEMNAKDYKNYTAK